MSDKLTEMARKAGAVIFDRDAHFGMYKRGGVLFTESEWATFRAALAQQAQPAAEKRVYLVATGVVHEGLETYTRHEDRPPPMCDSERLYAVPPEAQPAEVVAAATLRKHLAMMDRNTETDPNQPGHHYAKGWNAALRQLLDYLPAWASPPPQPVPAGKRTLRLGEPAPPVGPQVPWCSVCGGCYEWGGNGLWHHAGCSRIPEGHKTAWLETAQPADQRSREVCEPLTDDAIDILQEECDAYVCEGCDIRIHEFARAVERTVRGSGATPPATPVEPVAAKERKRVLKGYGECTCILTQYCDGTCRPIFGYPDEPATPGAEQS